MKEIIIWVGIVLFVLIIGFLIGWKFLLIGATIMFFVEFVVKDLIRESNTETEE